MVVKISATQISRKWLFVHFQELSVQLRESRYKAIFQKIYLSTLSTGDKILNLKGLLFPEKMDVCTPIYCRLFWFNIRSQHPEVIAPYIIDDRTEFEWDIR